MKTYNIPLLPKYTGKLTDKLEQCTIRTCELVDAYGVVAKQYVVADLTKTDESIYHRTIFQKGHKTSTIIGYLFVNLATGEFVVNIPNPLNRPSGIDLRIGFTNVQESETAEAA